MHEKLTAQEQRLAHTQGWMLDAVYDLRGYVAEVIFPTQSSPFKTPHEAKAFVWERAKSGDVLCRRALSIVASSELAEKTR